MAVERGLGSGGLPEAPMIPEEEIIQNVVDLPAQPGVTEFDDGSVVVGEYEEEQAPIVDVGFDGNLAEVENKLPTTECNTTFNPFYLMLVNVSSMKVYAVHSGWSLAFHHPKYDGMKRKICRSYSK